MPHFSDFLLMFKFLSHKFLRWISGVLLALLVIDLGYLYWHSPEPGVWLSFLLCALLASIAVALLAQKIPSLRRFAPISFNHYFYMLILASIVGLVRGLLGWQKVTWRSC